MLEKLQPEQIGGSGQTAIYGFATTFASASIFYTIFLICFVLIMMLFPADLLSYELKLMVIATAVNSLLQSAFITALILSTVMIPFFGLTKAIGK